MTSREGRAAELVSMEVCLSDIYQHETFLCLPQIKESSITKISLNKRKELEKNGNGISYYMTSISFCQETNFFI